MVVMDKRFMVSVLGSAGVLLVAVSTVVAMNLTKKDAEKREMEVQRPLIKVVEAFPEAVSFDVESRGTVQPHTETTLVAEVSGRVVEVSPVLCAGGVFEADELLLRLDDGDYRASLMGAEAEVARCEVKLLQEKALAEQALRDWTALGRDPADAGILVLREPQLKEAEADVQSARATLEHARRNCERTRICAPYRGMVRERTANLGQYVSPGTPVAQVFAIDYAEVRLPFMAEDLRFVRVPEGTDGGSAVGAEVRLRSRFGQAREWHAELVRKEGVVDPQTRVMHVVARVEDPYGGNGKSGALAMGCFVEASISGVSQSGVVVLPRHALRDNRYVLVVDGESRLYSREVDVLRTDSDRVFIREGLSKGDRVCVSPMDVMVEGMYVEVVASQTESSSDGQPADASEGESGNGE